MNKKYIIQIEKDNQYPFDGASPPGLDYAVRVNYNFLNNRAYQNVSKNLQLLMQLDSPTLISFSKIREIRGKGFVVDYEYVPDLLKNSARLNEPTFIAELKVKIYSLFQSLSEKGISWFPSLEHIGLTQEGEPKVYVNLDFQQIAYEKAHLLSKYQRWNEQLFSTINSLKVSGMMRSEYTLPTDYSQIFGQKISDLQQRIGKMRRRSNSENQTIKENKKQKKVNMVLEYLPQKKNRNNSYCQQQGSHQLSLFSRQHRPSLGEPGAQKIHLLQEEISQPQSRGKQLDESAQECNLARRVSQAMEKSKFTFKMFQKLHRKSKRRN